MTLAKAPDTSPDSDGYFEALDPAGWWCSIVPFEPGQSDGTRSTWHRVVGRYRADLTVDCRVLWGTRQLFVRGVQNVSGDSAEITLLCEEVS